MCQADPALLKQVFVNLLANALKFTSQREVAVIEVGCGPGVAVGSGVTLAPSPTVAATAAVLAGHRERVVG